MDRVTSPYFDNTVLEIFEQPVTTAERAALNAFASLPTKNRAQNARHLFAYYRDTHACDDDPEELDDLMGVPATPEVIWPHVAVYSVCARTNPDDGLAYVMVSGNCAWEPEHGLLMVWREGRVLNKVGGYDDHLTNAYAYGDATLENVVYRARDATFTTSLD
jgi:hypothetical protein